MKRLQIGVAVLALAALPLSAGAQTDITGAWIVTVDSPQGQATIDATFKQAGEKITGEVMSPVGSVDFAGTLIKNALAVTYALPIQGQTLEIRMNGVVANDAMSGSVDFGGMGEAAWTAKRKPASDAVSAAPAPVPAPVPVPVPAGGLTSVAGKWNITVQMGANSLPMTGAFTQAGEAVTGTLNTALGALPVSGTLVEKKLTLHFTAQTPQGDMAVTMTGELGPDGLAGRSSVAGLGESDWSAKRIE